MNIITLDFETYFDQDYSLKKMTTEEYVRDPRFEVHGMAMKDGPTNKGRSVWLPAHMLKYTFEIADWSQFAILCHHVQFDGLILAHHYGIVPKAYLDTLSMARLLLGNHVKHSLDGVREQLGLPAKRTPYEKFKGKHWDELDQFTQAEIAAGACDEVESIFTIFNRFMSGDY